MPLTIICTYSVGGGRGLERGRGGRQRGGRVCVSLKTDPTAAFLQRAHFKKWRKRNNTLWTLFYVDVYDFFAANVHNISREKP
jgi:hypothetical protein